MQEASDKKYLEFRRCVICGIRVYSSKAPQCEWCEDEGAHGILHSLLDRVTEFLETSEPSNPRDDQAMGFIADIGGLASKHPYLAWLRRALTMLLERGVVKRMSSPERIWGSQLIMRAKRILPLLSKINLCGFNVNDESQLEITWPKGSIIRRAHTWLQTDAGKNDTASFLLGFVLLHAIDESLEKIEENAALAFDEGVATLYPIEYSDSGMPSGLRLPKSITAVISFVLGSWARGWNEFDEFSLHKFLDARGVTGKDYNETIGLLSQTVPGISHGILDYETYSYGGVPIKRFRYSSAVLNLRELLREMSRERTR
ncbi:MAG: hypothetical protein ACFFER_19070 [Candidatus Thorarchaeota archaeon]